MKSKKTECPLCIHVLIIEDNRFIREGWEFTLSSTEDIKTIGSFENCEKAFSTDILKLTDVVLMDIGLPGMSGIEGVKYVKANYPEILIVMCTVNEDDNSIFEAICAGAVGYLLKRTTPDDLLAAIRESYNGGSPMTPSVARKVIASFQKIPARSDNPSQSLTDRENEILTRMANGKTYTAIASKNYRCTAAVKLSQKACAEKLFSLPVNPSFHFKKNTDLSENIL